MNRVIAASVLLCAGVMVDANAGCKKNQVTDLQTFLLNKHVCAVRGSDVWRERHDPLDKLFDIKMGPTDPVDPSKEVGTWKVTGSGASNAVAYTYNVPGAVSFTYKVYETGKKTSLYDFCDGPAIIVANAKIQTGVCP